MTPAEFQAAAAVSRETMARLEIYDALLRKWQRTINLVSASSLDDAWRRHFLDSAQLAPLAAGAIWLDLGSGAGFPGMVLAILGVGHVHLVESDQRKAAFLREVAAHTAAPVTIHAVRIESLSRAEIGPAGADVVTARALAPLDKLLDVAGALVSDTGTLLFPTGRHSVAAALTESRKSWRIDVTEIPSRTQSDSVILRLQGIRHADGHARSDPGDR